jgi:ferredoxin-nitrite reductase
VCRAVEVSKMLEAELDIPKPVRIHWTGCPNSCGQAQVADIGLMGGPAKFDGKAVEGVRVYTGGKIGEGATLAEQVDKGIPANPEQLVPYLRDLLIKDFGATAKVK